MVVLGVTKILAAEERDRYEELYVAAAEYRQMAQVAFDLASQYLAKGENADANRLKARGERFLELSSINRKRSYDVFNALLKSSEATVAYAEEAVFTSAQLVADAGGLHILARSVEGVQLSVDAALVARREGTNAAAAGVFRYLVARLVGSYVAKSLNFKKLASKWARDALKGTDATGFVRALHSELGQWTLTFPVELITEELLRKTPWPGPTPTPPASSVAGSGTTLVPTTQSIGPSDRVRLEGEWQVRTNLSICAQQGTGRIRIRFVEDARPPRYEMTPAPDFVAVLLDLRSRNCALGNLGSPVEILKGSSPLVLQSEFPSLFPRDRLANIKILEFRADRIRFTAEVLDPGVARPTGVLVTSEWSR